MSLQDLLADEHVLAVVGLLRLAAQRRSSEAWTAVSAALSALHDVAVDDLRSRRRLERELADVLKTCRAYMKGNAPCPEASAAVLEIATNYLGLARFRQAYRCYASGDLLDIAHEALVEQLSECAAASSTWRECLDLFEGTDAVPLMSVHKSKGLEYDTTIFVGLDDDAWWSHTPGGAEGLATFFVALSRAKQRAIFTYRQGRGRERVGDLYQLLADAGVREYRFNDNGNSSVP